MKIAYIYLNNLESKTADVNQTLNMVSALSLFSDVTFISSWVGKSEFKEVLDFFHIKNSAFKLFRTPLALSTVNGLKENLSRLVYVLTTYIHLTFSKYDIIYTRDFSFIYFLSILPKFMQLNSVVYEPHKIYHLTSDKVSFDQEKKANKIPMYFVPISNGIAEDLKVLFSISKDKITTLPDAVNLAVFEESNKKCKKEISIVYTGSFLPWKGVDILINSIAILKNDYQLKVAIAGGGTENELRKVKELIKSHNLDETIDFKGFLSQQGVAELISSSNISVIPNTSELISAKYTSPLKAFEYMAGKTAIVASNLDSMKEIFEEKKDCLLFDPGNSSDLAEKLKTLLDDQALMLSLQNNAVEKAKMNSWEERANNVVKIASSIC